MTRRCVACKNHVARSKVKVTVYTYNLCKNHVATSKVKFTVRTYSLCTGFSETCSCPAHNFVLAPASGMVQYRDPVFHPSVRPIKALSYSRHKAVVSVSYGHISFLV